MRESDYVVIRDPDAPFISGTWFDRLHGSSFAVELVGEESQPLVTYVPTPFIETREDGAVAQVYMRKQ